MVNLLEATFPGLLQSAYTITSPRSKVYNCVAWAAGENRRWWWPGPNPEEEYWPAGASRVETLDAFREAFTTLGYFVCVGEHVEPGYERIALFANDKGTPKHAARQLTTGRWTSKLGALEDIEHSLHDLEGAEYGVVAIYMKRPITAATPEKNGPNWNKGDQT